MAFLFQCGSKERSNEKILKLIAIHKSSQLRNTTIYAALSMHWKIVNEKLFLLQWLCIPSVCYQQCFGQFENQNKRTQCIPNPVITPRCREKVGWFLS